MGAYTLSTQALKNGVLKKCGEMQDGTSSYEVDGTVVDYINKAHLAVLSAGNEFVQEMSKPWPWALQPKPILFTIMPSITTLAVSVTAQSSTIGFSAIPVDWNNNQISLAGYWLQLIGRPEWFKIATHTSGTESATLEMAYTDQTSTSMESLIVLLDYTLTDPIGNGILRLAQSMKVYRPQDMQGDQEAAIYLDDEGAMLKMYPMNLMKCNTPTRFCVTSNINGVMTIRLNQYTQYATKVEARYIMIPTILLDTPGRPFQATVTIAAPGVFTANNGITTLNTNDPLVISTTGALPTGLTAGTTYYAVSIVGNQFSVAATPSGSAITTTGTQSGIHTISPAQAPTYPLVPVAFCELLEYVASHWLCVDKNDDRADKYMALAVAKGKALIAATEKEKIQSAKTRGKIIPRQDSYNVGRKWIVQTTD